MSQNENSNQLSAMISQLLSDPQKVQQFQQMASSLGLGAAPDSAPSAPMPNPAPDAPPAPSAPPDFSAMLGSLQSALNQNQSAPAPSNSSAPPDFSAMLGSLQSALSQNQSAPAPSNAPGGMDFSALLQGLGASNPTPQNGTNPSPPPFDLSALMGAFGQNQQPQSAAPMLDMSSIMKIQQAMQMFTKSNPNVDLLRAMRPLLSEKRAKKVDDAIRIMQLIQMLPLLKESGLFGLGGEQK